MKKKIIVSILILSILLAGGVGLYFLLDKKTDDLPLNHYYINVKFDDDFKKVELYQEFTFYNNKIDNLDTLAFNLYPNAYAKDAVYPAYDKKQTAYGKIELKDVIAENKDSSFQLNEGKNLLIITLNEPLKLNSSVKIIFEGKLTVPINSLRFGTMNQVLNLCNFYPVLAGFENGNWRNDRFTKIGDPFYSDIADYDVNVECGEDIKLAHSGVQIEDLTTEGRNIKLQAKNVRDFAIVASKRFKLAETAYKNIAIKYYYLSDSSYQDSLELAKNAVQVFSEAFGEYPYPEYTIVETNFSHGGMEYPNLSLLSDKNSGNYKIDTIIHETAHQWFSCLVGSDSIKNPWIDEGLTTFATNFYYILNNNKNKYDDLRNADLVYYNSYVRYKKRDEPAYNAFMRRGIYSFNDDYEYSLIAYTKASLMYDAFYKSFGRYKTEKTIRKFVEDFSYKNITEEEFINVFSSYGKASGLFNSWLDGKVVTF